MQISIYANKYIYNISQLNIFCPYVKSLKAISLKSGACSTGGKFNSNGCLPVCLHLSEQKHQRSEHGCALLSSPPPVPHLEDIAIFAHLSFPQAVCKVLQEYTHNCLPGGWSWGMGTCYCAKCWNWPKLTTIYHPSLPLEVASLQQMLEVPNNYIRKILPF